MLKLKTARIKELIEATGYTPSAWAVKYGFGHATLFSWLSEIRTPKKENLIMLANALGVEPEEISQIVIKPDTRKLAVAEKEKEVICALWSDLTMEQRHRVLELVQRLVDGNRAMEELK